MNNVPAAAMYGLYGMVEYLPPPVRSKFIEDGIMLLSMYYFNTHSTRKKAARLLAQCKKLDDFIDVINEQLKLKRAIPLEENAFIEDFEALIDDLEVVYKGRGCVESILNQTLITT